jgi:DNA-binding NarL/FixJ family response regulator
VVLDWHLPGMPGPQLIRAVTTAGPGARIVVVYSSDTAAARAATLGGAAGFTVKGSNLLELFTAIRRGHGE